jgi:FAD binding domain
MVTTKVFSSGPNHIWRSSILHSHGLRLTRGSIRHYYASMGGLQGISFTQIFVSAFALVPAWRKSGLNQIRNYGNYKVEIPRCWEPLVFVFISTSVHPSVQVLSRELLCVPDPLTPMPHQLPIFKMRLHHSFVRVLLKFLSVNSVIAANLFPFETVQLQESELAALSAEHANLLTFSTPAPSKTAKCKVFPGDEAWPTDAIWAYLNSTTSNRGLIKTIPIAAPCYAGSPYNVYSADKCTYITNQWSNSSLQYVSISFKEFCVNASYSMEDPTSMMSPVFEGLTCVPPLLADTTTGQGVNCTIGGYPSYVINASDVRDIQLGVNFARNNGIRLVIKNTGHDFSGKSGGAGSLSIWTHYLKDIAFLPNFNDGAGYAGPAFKAGSGVQAWEIYAAAHAKGMVVVGGEGRVRFPNALLALLTNSLDRRSDGRVHSRRWPLAPIKYLRHRSRSRSLHGSCFGIGKVRHSVSDSEQRSLLGSSRRGRFDLRSSHVSDC